VPDVGKHGVLVMVTAIVSGCGGGSSAGKPGSGTSYGYVPPVLNSTRNYAETIADNSNNTINIGFSETVQAVNADGSVSEIEQSTTGGSTIVNGTNYAIPTEMQTYNAQGQETGYVDLSNSPTTSCSFDPHGAGPNWPVLVGQTWSLDYTFVCGTAAAVSYTQSGSVADVETVTVPAGSFTAIKLQTTITWTSAGGTTRTQTTTNWRDVATSHSVRQDISIAVSGTLPTTGYAVNREILLESTS
jgi:hypothetical protein